MTQLALLEGLLQTRSDLFGHLKELDDQQLEHLLQLRHTR
jgi:hypothetical protein